jgi:drug/metabolite transporter (DMT)-like permease
MKSPLIQKRELSMSFFRKGITIAILSGMCYGLYSSFITVAMGRGIWIDWYGVNTAGLSSFTVVYVLGALGSAINDTCSAIWAFAMAALKGKAGDFFRCLKTKPGAVMIVAALIGGPIASTAYIVSLQMAGSIIIPITALCPAIGALLGRLLFKQALNGRMICGVIVCVAASIMIGSTGMGGDAPEGRLLGCLIAFIAALGWGIEGCVAGYGTTLIDYEIGITIRQTTSGLSNLIILVPLMSMIAGDIGIAGRLFGAAVTSAPSMIFFIVSGFFALFAYSLWYKGNSMCGAALGMACNGAYSFWGPLFCWIIIGLSMGQEGWALPPIAWVAAIVMFIGILIIAVNPLDLFRKKEAA